MNRLAETKQNKIKWNEMNDWQIWCEWVSEWYKFKRQINVFKLYIILYYIIKYLIKCKYYWLINFNYFLFFISYKIMENKNMKTLISFILNELKCNEMKSINFNLFLLFYLLF